MTNILRYHLRQSQSLILRHVARYLPKLLETHKPLRPLENTGVFGNWHE